MGRTLGIFVSFVVLLGAGAGLTVAAWPHAQSETVMGSDEKLEKALARVSPGMPVSQLATAGLDVAQARRLSALALMEAFLPKDSADFVSLDPALVLWSLYGFFFIGTLVLFYKTTTGIGPLQDRITAKLDRIGMSLDPMAWLRGKPQTP